MIPVWKHVRRGILPRTLYWRSLMILVIPILLIQMIVAYVFVDRHWNSTSDKLVLALSGEIATLTAVARDGGDIDTLAALAARNLSMDVMVEPPSATPKRLRRPGDLAWQGIEKKLNDSLRRKLTESFVILPRADGRRFEVVVRLDDSRTLRFLCYNHRLMGPATLAFFAWLIGSAIILTAIAVIFMRNQIRPILRLAVAAEKLGKGQDVPQFKVEGAREVRQAAHAFIEMRDRIRRQVEQRTAMLAGVSHDLRTPLTRMKLQLALIKDADASADFQRDIEEMERMLEGYLAFARGEGNEETSAVDLQEMLERIVSNARRQGHDIEAAYDSRASLRARPVALERALSNVVGNACKYAKQVRVNVRVTAEAAEITVDDNGPGIPFDKRDEVFRPFTRLEKSRNPKTGGVGLGLSIAQDIIHAHGGEIALGDNPDKGLRVTIRLPL